MEAGSDEMPPTELGRIETPVVKLGLEENVDDTLQDGDSLATLLDQGTGEDDLCVDEPRGVEFIATSSSAGVSRERLETAAVVSDNLEQPKEDHANKEAQVSTRLELYEEGKGDVFGATHQETVCAAPAKESGAEKPELSTSLNVIPDAALIKRTSLSLEIGASEREGESSPSKDSSGNLEFLVSDDPANSTPKQDKSIGINDQVKEVPANSLSQRDSYILETDKADFMGTSLKVSAENESYILALSNFRGEVSEFQESNLLSQVKSLEMKTDDEVGRSGGKAHEEGAKNTNRTEVNVKADKEACSLVAFYSRDGDEASNVASTKKTESSIEISKTDDSLNIIENALEVASERDARKLGKELYDFRMKQDSNIPEIGDVHNRESDLKKDAVSLAFEMLPHVTDGADGFVGVQRDPDFNRTVQDDCGQFHGKEGNAFVDGPPLLVTKQAGQDDDPAIQHYRGSAPEGCSSLLLSGKAEEYQILDGCPLVENGLDPCCSAQLKHAAATSSDEQWQQGYGQDKDGGSSIDSTAGSGERLPRTEPQTALDDANSSSSEDSANSPAHCQPSPQQRKKRIDLHHQFVREIVKIQHDREQYDRGQLERLMQAQKAASSIHVEAKATETQEKKNIPVRRKHLRTNLGKHLLHRRLRERGPDEYVKDLQQQHDTETREVAAAQAKGGSTQVRESIHEGRGQGQPTFFEAENSSVGSEKGKFGRSKHHRYMPIYRLPSARESLATGLDEQKVGDSSSSYHESPSLVVSHSPDSSTGSVSGSSGSSMGMASLGSPIVAKDKGKLTVVKSTSGERYVHYTESQVDQSTVNMGIKVTFDTEKQQRHIAFSNVTDPVRQRKHHEQKSLTDFDSGLEKFQDIHETNYTSQASASLLGILPPHSQGQAMSAMNSSEKGKFSQQTERGLLSQSTLKSDLASPPVHFQVTFDKVPPSGFEGKHGFSQQASIPVVMKNPYSSFQEASLSPAHFRSATDGRINSTHSGKSRCAKDYPIQFSSLQTSNTASGPKATTLKHPWSNSDRKERSIDVEHHQSINQQMTTQIQHVNTLSTEKIQNNINGKGKVASVSADRVKEKRESKTKNRVKGSKSPFINPSISKLSSHAQLASGISKVEPEARSVRKIPACEENQANVQESIESDKTSRFENTRKGSTQNAESQLSPLFVEGSVLRTTRLLGKWGDIVDDSPDSYDYLQMKMEVGSDGGSEGPQLRGHSYKHSSASSSDFISEEKPALKESIKGDSGAKQNNKAAAVEVAQKTLVHSSNGTPARRSVWERLGPPNVSGASILGPPPKAFDGRGVLRAFPDIIQSKTFNFGTTRSFKFGANGPVQASHRAPLSSMLDDSHYDKELGSNRNDECTEVVLHAYRDMKQRRSKRELYVPRRGS